MEKPLSLRLLYTAHIRGDLALLPRLHTALQRLRPAARRGPLLLDLGDSCADAVWHCQATGGRSTLIVLDGMGFHAANVQGLLSGQQRDKLAAQTTLALVDERTDWRYSAPPLVDSSIIATLRPQVAAARLQIVLRPAARTRLEGNALYLQDVAAGQIGLVDVDLRGQARLAAARVVAVETPPNASIAGAVEFVEAEARLYARRQV